MAILRRAVAADLPVLLNLVREFCEADQHPFDEQRITRALLPLLDGDELGQVWLFRDGPAEAAGYAVVTWGYSLESGGREALLDEIYVRDRGRGVGGRALEEILQACARAGVRRVFLETEAHNHAVRRFYARHGFVVEDSIWMLHDLGLTKNQMIRPNM